MAIIQHLVVDDYGAFISKHQGRLRVTVKKEKRLEAPLMHLQTLLISGHGVSISADAIAACAENGIPVHIIDTRGAPVASMYASALIGTVRTRRAQLLAYDTSKGLEAARALVLGKIRNQSVLLKYVAKYRKEKDPPRYAVLRDGAIDVLAHEEEALALSGARVDDIRGQLLSVEGRAAQHYWKALKVLVPPELAWPGRRGRDATDLVNMAINYGYGILYGEIERACVLAGLDPYGGFLHTDRPGKPSLVLDFIEPFRPAVVDRTILALVGKGSDLALDDRGRLTQNARHMLADKVHRRLDAPARYQGQRLSLRAIIQRQARELARYFREEHAIFEAFVATW